VLQEPQRNLPQILPADRLPAPFANGDHRRQQQRHQQTEGRNHHEDFDKRDGIFRFSHHRPLDIRPAQRIPTRKTEASIVNMNGIDHPSGSGIIVTLTELECVVNKILVAHSKIPWISPPVEACFTS